MGADRRLVGLRAPPRLVGHDKLTVLELRRIREQFRVPRQAIDVDFHDPQIGRGSREVRVHHRGQVAVKIMRRDIGIDPVHFDSSYNLYPDGPVAVETLRVIGAAMAEAGVVGLGRLTLSRRERMVVVEPRGIGMALFTLRAAEELRASQFGIAEDELDAEMVAIARRSLRSGPEVSIQPPTETATRRLCES